GHVDGHRVKGGEHAHIRHDGRVVLGVAVAVGGDLVYDVDVEVGTAVHHSLGILGDLAVEVFKGLVLGGLHGVLGAHADAPAAADALTIVDGVFAVFNLATVVGADLFARAAAVALLLIPNGLAGGV